MINTIKPLLNISHYVINQKNHIINYSKQLGRPLWVAYSVNKKNLQNAKGGRRNFILDTNLVKNNINQLNPKSNIFNNGLTRGHLSPSYLMSWDKTIDGPWYSTYKMSNVVPQNELFNTKYWIDVEREAYNMILNNDSTTCIITGASSISNTNSILYSNKLPNNLDLLDHNLAWIDENNNKKYIIPNIIYQIIITQHEIICHFGVNSSKKQIYPIKLDILEQLINLKIFN